MKYEELNAEQKARAVEKIRETWGFSWESESRDSLLTFMAHFGIDTYWSLDTYHWYFNKVEDNSYFRGMKLTDFDPEYMPTGYCLDCDLWGTFYEEFKSTGDARAAFNAALETGLKAWAEDRQYQLTDEYLIEHIIVNELDFCPCEGIHI
ncbi:MAG: hypothetical protein RBQ99_01650 [Trichlorobacter sp.]|nr:hypothetical protein [Trichlorobacter sp.]